MNIPESSEEAIRYHSITIGDGTNWINTWDDWHLVPTSRPLVPPPGVRTSYVEIPGANGALDLSEVLTGYPTYQNRSGSWEFLVMNGYQDWQNHYSDIMTFLHGKKMYMILNDDPNYYYEGRLSVHGWQSPKNWSKVTIGYNVGPYKIRVDGSDEDWYWDPFNFETDDIHDYKDIAVSSSVLPVTVHVTNDIMRVKPVIYASATGMKVWFKNKSYNLDYGDNTIREVVLAPGDNELGFTGFGTITIKFHGGRF